MWYLMWYLGTKTGHFELNKHLSYKQGVGGSSPPPPTKLKTNWKSGGNKALPMFFKTL